MRRSRLGWAGLISLLLHVALLALIWDREPVRSEPPPPAPPPLVVEILPSPAEPPAPPPPPSPPPAARPERPRPRPPAPTPVPPEPVRPPVPPEPVRPPEPPEEAPPAAPAPAPPIEEAPPASPPPEPPEPSPPSEEAPPEAAAEAPALATAPPPDAPLEPQPQRPSLLPPSPEEGWSVPMPEEKPRGRTLRPGDPSLAPEVLRAEEEARVTERVQTFAEDELAKLRVENGLVHPYFGQMRASLEKQLENAPLFDLETTGQQLQKLARSYLESAEHYGATGTTANAPAKRSAPTATERLEAISKGNPAHDSMRAFLSAGEAMQQMAESSPELVVIVEMQQESTGQLRSVKVVEPSGNKAFDKYVLEAVPPSLTRLAPPPEKATGIRPEGIRTIWAVEGRVVYLRKLSELEGQDAWYVAGAAGLGVLAGRFEETTGDIYVIDLRNPKFEVRPRLLRVY